MRFRSFFRPISHDFWSSWAIRFFSFKGKNRAWIPHYWHGGIQIPFGSQILKGRFGRTRIDSICNPIWLVFFQYGIRWISLWYHQIQLGVSQNGGTPKSSISIGFSIINHPFWGTPIFWNTQYNSSQFFPLDQEESIRFQPLLLRKNIDILTAMAVGSDSIWVAGEPRLLLRLGGTWRLLMCQFSQKVVSFQKKNGDIEWNFNVTNSWLSCWCTYFFFMEEKLSLKTAFWVFFHWVLF